MPDTDVLVSELTQASSINTTDLLLMTQPDGDAQTGYSSRKGTVLQVANKLLKDTEYTTDLANFENKTVFGALNEIHNGVYLYKENETPYQLRQTPLTANRCLEKLIGVSCAFNQLFKPVTYSNLGITITTSNGELTINGTSTAVNYITVNSDDKSISGHKYFVSFELSESINGIQFYNDNQGVIVFNGTDIQSATGNETWYIRIGENVTFDNVTVTPQIIDLTACFGSEVADYLYNLENG